MSLSLPTLSAKTVVAFGTLAVVSGFFASFLLVSHPKQTIVPKAPVSESTISPQPQEATVAGVIATPTPIESTSPTKTKVVATLVDCVGPDGKHAQATQEDCNNLNNFWNAQHPTTNSQGSTAHAGTTTSTSTTPEPTATPTPGQNQNTNPTATPTPTPTPGGKQCTAVSFSETKTTSGVDVLVSGAWYLTVKAAPTWQNVDFNTNNLSILLHFSVPTGTVSIYLEDYPGAPLCQTYNFGN